MPAKNIIVAGAGIIGASIAYHLARRGAKVTILEASQPSAGASGTSFGWINATFSKRPRSYYDFNLHGMRGWRRLERELDGLIKVQWGGSVAWLPHGPESDELRQSVRDHAEWGYKTRLIDKLEFEQLLPNVSPGEIAIACYCEEEAAVEPSHAVTVLLRKAAEFGAELRSTCQVTSIDRAGVRTSQEALAADLVVLACGVDSPRLANQVGVRIPLKDAPGVLVHTAPLPRLIHRIVLAPTVHLKQQADGRIVAGGQVVAGAGTAASPVVDAEQIFEQARHFLPQLSAATVERATLGFRVMPEDEYPIIGFARPRLYVAATHSGVTLAPVIGELAASEILDERDLSILAPYRLSRFL